MGTLSCRKASRTKLGFPTAKSVNARVVRCVRSNCVSVSVTMHAEGTPEAATEDATAFASGVGRPLANPSANTRAGKATADSISAKMYNWVPKQKIGWA
jgi:hypothetical protein